MAKEKPGRALRQGIRALATGNGLVQVASLALAPVVSRLYAPEHFGVFAYVMVAAAIATALGTLRLEYALIIPKDDAAARAVLRTALGTLGVGMAGLGVVLWVASRWFENPPFFISIAHWGIAVGGVMGVYQLFFYYRIRQRHYRATAIAQALAGVGAPLVSIGWAAWKGADAEGLAVGMAVAHGAGAMWLWPGRGSLRTPSMPLGKVLRKFRHFPMFNLPHALVNIGSANILYLMLGRPFGNATVGHVSMAVGKVWKGIQWWTSSTYPVLSREVMGRLHGHKPSTTWLRRFVARQAVVVVPLAVLLGWWAPDLFGWFFGAPWATAGAYLRYLLPWLVMASLTGPLSFLPNLLNRQRPAFFWELFSLGMRTGGLAVGIAYGTVEAALVGFSTLGTLALLLLLWWYFRILSEAEQYFPSHP